MLLRFSFLFTFLSMAACLLARSEENSAMDKQTAEFLNLYNKAQLPPLDSVPVAQLRQFVDSFGFQSDIELASIQDIKIPGPAGEIPIRIYKPFGNGPFPVYVTFHGGGWVFGSLNLYDPTCREIASQAQVIVVSVDYRLAPEHKFPVPLNDCYAATEWVAKNIQNFNGDPSRLAIGGDSAGGNLAIGVTLLAKEKGFPNFKAQVLVYPVTQYAFDTPSYQKYQKNYYLTRDQMKWFWSLYLNNPEEGKNPLASPLLAKDVAKLPAALIVQAEFDPLFDEGHEYGQRLEQAGIPVTFKVYPSIHVFFSMSNQLDVSKVALQDVSLFLKKNLNN